MSERTLRALLAIRRESLLPKLFGKVVISESNYEAVLADEAAASWREAGPPPWLYVLEDQPDKELPERVSRATDLEAASLRLAATIPASVVLIDGPIKDSAKLSFFKCEGTVPILVMAYRQGHLSAVEPMVKALERLGHGDVLPPPDMLAALWDALERLD